MITQFQVSELVGNAFQKAATLTNALNYFQATGIWPFNRTILTEAGFLAVATTNINLAESVSIPESRQTLVSNS